MFPLEAAKTHWLQDRKVRSKSSHIRYLIRSISPEARIVTITKAASSNSILWAIFSAAYQIPVVLVWFDVQIQTAITRLPTKVIMWAFTAIGNDQTRSAFSPSPIKLVVNTVKLATSLLTDETLWQPTSYLRDAHYRRLLGLPRRIGRASSHQILV